MCNIFGINLATCAGNPDGAIVDGRLLVGGLVESDFGLGEVGALLLGESYAHSVGARGQTGEVDDGIVGAERACLENVLLIVDRGHLVDAHGALLILVGSVEDEWQLERLGVDEVEVGLCEMDVAVTAYDEGGAILLRLTGGVGANGVKRIDVVAITVFLLFEEAVVELKRELAFVICNHQCVGNVRIGLSAFTPPVPFPRVLVEGEPHFGIGHRHARVGECLARDDDGLVGGEHIAVVVEGDVEGGRLVLAHIHIVAAEVTIGLVVEPDVILAIEPAGGNLELSLDASELVGYQLEGVESNVVGIKEGGPNGGIGNHFVLLDFGTRAVKDG